MKKLVFLIVVLFATQILASGMQASFESSRLDGLVRQTTVLEYRGIVDESNNLIDFAGENLFTYRTGFDNAAWTKSLATVTADSIRAPDGTLTADTLAEDGTAANTHFIHQSEATTSGVTYTFSVWVREANRNWVALRANSDALTSFFNVETGQVGTCPVNVTCGIAESRGGFYRVYMTWISSNTVAQQFWIYIAEADNDAIFDGQTQDSLYIWGAQLKVNDEWRSGLGVFLNPSDQTVDKPNHDLAPTSAPTAAKEETQYMGNKLPARAYDGAGQYYSKADHGSLDIYTGEFTITTRYRWDSSGAATDYIYAHGNFNSNGCYIYLLNASVNCRCNGGAATYTSTYAIDTRDDDYHTIQCVQDSSQDMTLYVDGNAGNTVSTVGTVEPTQIFYIGASNTGINTILGRISYFRLDEEALSTDRLAYERDVLLGLAAHTGFSDPGWTFTRATTAMKDFSDGECIANNPKLDVMASGVPRSSNGVLIESQKTNLCLESETFNDGTWGKFRSSVVTDSIDAPDGTTTVDILHEDNTAASTHYMTQSTIPVDNATQYTYSVYVGAINRDWVYLAVFGAGIINGGQWFNVAEGRIGTAGAATTYQTIDPICDGLYRISITDLTTAAGNITTYLYIGEADADDTFDGLDQDSLYVWGAQVEASRFPTSYIETVATATTRNGDSLRMDPHAAGTNETILAETYCDTCTASKFTLYYEVKCHYEDNAQAGDTYYWIDLGNTSGTSQWNRNRIVSYFASGGRVTSGFKDDSSTLHQIASAADAEDYSDWLSVRFFIDLEDLSRMDMWLAQPPGSAESNAGMAYTANAGTATWDTTNVLIRVGEQNNSTPSANCKIRNLRIYNAEVTP